MTTLTTADPEELRRFERLADQWWDERGPLAPLHKLNPTRIGYIRDQLCARFDRDPHASAPLDRLDVLDVGCGAGILSEPLARLGARVTGVDLVAAGIEAAQHHAAMTGLEVSYRRESVDDQVAAGQTYDLVCVMEVVEHVADVGSFLSSCGRLVRPGGGLVLATLNRTARSYVLGIVAAEYVLGWLPRGTHQWSRFVRPSEATRALRRAGLTVRDLSGVVYDPFRDRFRLSADTAVNYMLFVTRD